MYYSLAAVRVEQGELAQALELGKKAVELDPGNEDVAILYAELLEKDGQYEEALEALRPMLEREPPVFGAVMTFGKFAPLIEMKDEAEILIGNLKQQDNLTDQQQETIREALDWLKDQV